MYGIMEKWKFETRGKWVINENFINTRGYSAIRYYDSFGKANAYAKRQNDMAINKHNGCVQVSYKVKKLTKERYENSKVFYENGRRIKNQPIKKKVLDHSSKLVDDDDVCYILEFNS